VTRRRRDLAIDLGFCAAIAAYSLPPMLDGDVNDPGAVVWGPLLLPTLLAPILLRRARPLAAAAALAAACVVSALPTLHQFRFIAAVPVAVLVLVPLAVTRDRREALGGLVLVLAGLAVVGGTDAVLEDHGGVAGLIAFSWPLCLAVWGAGRLVRSRERLAAELQERTEQLRRERDATAALAVETERERLAADLELAARARLQEILELAAGAADDEAEGRARFARIEGLGRESLDHMRTLLGLLRTADRGARAPRPTLEQLDALLAQARSGGQVVTLEVAGEHRPLSAGVELAAYRAVQHALVAVGDGPATVRVRYGPLALDLEVDGPPAGGSAGRAALVAARERVTALGGEFAALTPAPGRQVVRLRLPTVAAHA